ncbi:MAG: site-specific DNA-methyltransferase [Desulfobulbaceae bacterium]|nr:site-specific DNA-methyltransferase [Desulfobulbaceae bacterium]
MINLHNIDCLKFMRDLPDKCYDLAIVDPPYFDKCKKMIFPGSEISTTGVRRNRFESKHWKIPGPTYFKQLVRVSEYQIIWGCNYFAKHIPHTGRIVWDKKNDESTFSKAEIASKSSGVSVDMFRYMWNGMLQENMSDKEFRIHPTQKPVALYKWLLKNYAKPGDKILDTHGGSMSIAIACYDMGFDLDLCELDKDYFNAGKARVDRHMAQERLFEP